MSLVLYQHFVVSISSGGSKVAAFILWEVFVAACQPLIWSNYSPLGIITAGKSWLIAQQHISTLCVFIYKWIPFTVQHIHMLSEQHYMMMMMLCISLPAEIISQWSFILRWGSAVASGDVRFSSVVRRAAITLLNPFWVENCLHATPERERGTRKTTALPPPLSALCFASSVSLSPFPPLVAHPTHPLLPPPPSPPTIKPSFPALFFLFALLCLTNWVYKADALLMFFPLSCFVSYCTVYVFWATCNKFPACRSHCLFPSSSAPSPHKFVCPH